MFKHLPTYKKFALCARHSPKADRVMQIVKEACWIPTALNSILLDIHGAPVNVCRLIDNNTPIRANPTTSVY